MKAEVIEHVHLGNVYVLVTTSGEWPNSSFSNQHMITFTGGRKSQFANAFAALINNVEEHRSLPAVKHLDGIL